MRTSLIQDRLIAPPELDDKDIPTQKDIWRIRANNTIEHEELLEVNLEATPTRYLRTRCVTIKTRRPLTISRMHWIY